MFFRFHSNWLVLIRLLFHLLLLQPSTEWSVKGECDVKTLSKELQAIENPCKFFFLVFCWHMISHEHNWTAFRVLQSEARCLSKCQEDNPLFLFFFDSIRDEIQLCVNSTSLNTKLPDHQHHQQRWNEFKYWRCFFFVISVVVSATTFVQWCCTLALWYFLCSLFVEY